VGSWWNAHTEVAYAPSSEEDLVRLEAAARASATGSQLSDINTFNVALFAVGGLDFKLGEVALAFVGKKAAVFLVRTGADRAALYFLNTESRWARLVRLTRVRVTARAGESAFTKATGIAKNTRRAYDASGRYRVPDGWNAAANVLYEVKNVGSQSYTKQLRDLVAWAKNNGYTLQLWTRTNTTLSAPLEDAVARGDIVRIRGL
jgi:hypothetical protein